MITGRQLIQLLAQVNDLDAPIHIFVGVNQDTGIEYGDFEVMIGDDNEGNPFVEFSVIDENMDFYPTDTDDDYCDGVSIISGNIVPLGG